MGVTFISASDGGFTTHPAFLKARMCAISDDSVIKIGVSTMLVWWEYIGLNVDAAIVDRLCP